MTEVFYSSARVTEFDYNVSLPAKLEELLQRVDLSQYIERGEYVAVKMHLGSQGAFRTVRPAFVRKIVEAVKAVGGSPFVTDTVRIPGLEYLDVANANGINHLSVGAPVVMADGLFGKDVINVPAGELLGEIGVASAIYEAQAMIVVSHCKGHIGAGYGGAIKNLGMGGIGAKTVRAGPNGAVCTSPKIPTWSGTQSCAVPVTNVLMFVRTRRLILMTARFTSTRGAAPNVPAAPGSVQPRLWWRLSVRKCFSAVWLRLQKRWFTPLSREKFSISTLASMCSPSVTACRWPMSR